MKDFACWLKSGIEDSKYEPCARLTEMSCCALCGFGQLQYTLVVGVYNKDRKITLLLQGTSGKERLRDLGARIPVGGRIASAAVSLQFGPLSPGNAPGELM